MKTFKTFDRPEGWPTPTDAFAQDFLHGDRVQVAPWGGFAILGHRELLQLSRNPAADGAPPDKESMSGTPQLYELLIRAVFTNSGDVHRAQRVTLIAAFNSVPLADVIEKALQTVLISAPEEISLRDDLVNPIVRAVWSGIIGLSPDESIELDMAVRDLGYMLSPSPEPEKAHLSEAAAATVRRLSTEAVTREIPFTSSLRTIGEEQAADLIAGMVFDGLESLATGVDAALRVAFANRNAIEPTGQCANECLRLASPTPMTMRLSTAPIVLDDLKIDAGTMLSMVWAAGNHDPQVFPNPGSFNSNRGAARPLTFGMGRHACLGHAVVRSTLVSLLGVLDRLHPTDDTQPEAWRPLARDWLPATTVRVGPAA